MIVSIYQVMNGWTRMKTKQQYETAARSCFIGWIGIIACILLQLVTCQTAPAQTMYEVQYESQADIKLYEVDYPSQADIKYYEVEYRSQANEQRNHWYWTEYSSQAKYKVYWVRYKAQADKLVYRVRYPSQTQ